MTTFHKSVATQLNSKKDRDILEFIESEVSTTGVSNSALIKTALRFYMGNRDKIDTGRKVDSLDKEDLIRQLVKEELQRQEVVEEHAETNTEVYDSTREASKSNGTYAQVDKYDFDDDLEGNFSKEGIKNIIGED